MATEILSLDEIIESQAGKYLTHNTALRELEAQLVRVLSRTTVAEPASPAEGDTYILPVGATGTNWATKDIMIAHYYNSSWTFYIPTEGLSIHVIDENKRVYYDGSNWVSYDDPVGTPSISTGVLDLDTEINKVFDISLTENITTLNLNNAPNSGMRVEITLKLTQDATGGRTVSWPTSIVWSGGTAPTITATVNATDVVSLFSINGGTTWFGSVIGADFS